MTEDIKLFNLEGNPEKELLWLPKALVKQLKDIDNSAIAEELILAYVKKAKQEVQNEIESYDEEILSFKAASAKIKKVYGETLDQFLEDSYKIWEEFDKCRESIDKKTKEVTNTLNPLEQKLTKIDNLLSNISVKLYSLNLDKIEQLLRITKQLDNLGGIEKTIIASVLEGKFNE